MKNGIEVVEVQETLDEMQARAAAIAAQLDDYKTEICCLNKPDLVRAANALRGPKRYTAQTKNYLMIGHLMTARKRALGYEDLLDAIDARKKAEAE